MYMYYLIQTCVVKFLSNIQFEFQFEFVPDQPPVVRTLFPPVNQPPALPGFPTFGIPTPDLFEPSPGGGPRDALFIDDHISCWVSDQLQQTRNKFNKWRREREKKIRESNQCILCKYLWKFWLLFGGLKLHVDDVVRPNVGKSVGEFLLVALAKISASFGVGFIANGDLATLPGVILGSSSMLFICEPLN